MAGQLTALSIMQDAPVIPVIVLHKVEYAVPMAEALVDACARAGFAPTIRTEVRETATLVAFVASGLGVALVPRSVAEMGIPGVAYVPLTDEITIDLIAGWRTDVPATVDHVVDRLAALASPAG